MYLEIHGAVFGHVNFIHNILSDGKTDEKGSVSPIKFSPKQFPDNY